MSAIKLVTAFLLCFLLLSQKFRSTLLRKNNSNKLLIQLKTKEIQKISFDREVTPLENFLNAVSNSPNKTFCIKTKKGNPKKFKSFNCPYEMKIYEENRESLCIKDCPADMELSSQFCEEKCKEGYLKEIDSCVNSTNTKEKYLIKKSAIEKKNPICINGYFLDGFCHSCLGHFDYSKEACLTPCEKGAILESFCAFDDFSNFRLSMINADWASFLRNFYSEIFQLFKKFGNNLYKNATNLSSIAEIVRENADNQKVLNDCGKIIVFLKSKFFDNLRENKTSLRNFLMKMFSFFSEKDNETKADILSVIDDLLGFEGNFMGKYFSHKNFVLKSLAFSVANIIDLLC